MVERAYNRSQVLDGGLHTRRILVIRLDEIGDVVMSAAMLRELRRNFPDAWVTLVVNPVTYHLVSLCPYVDEVLTFDQRVPRLLRPLILPWRAMRLARHRLRGQCFDLCVVPRWDTDAHYAGLLGYFSGALHRLGYSEAVNERRQQFNHGFDRLFTEVLTDRAARHEIERNELLLRALGAHPTSRELELWLDPADLAFAARAMEPATPKGMVPRVAVHLGAGAPQRRWPVESYVALARWLRKTYGAGFVVVGGPSEQQLAHAFASALGEGVIVTAGRASLRQTGAILRECDLFVGNDSGPKHLAAAASIPVLEISSFPADGPHWHWNSPVRFSAWGVAARVLQPHRALPPCYGGCSAAEPHCIRQVTVRQACVAAAELLRECRPSVA